ncbi:MAG: hypothetical protein HW394_767, partial [Acidobacteria bacterium]|nr:hypothetical protein [Acidobacteriota bacterium]
LDDLLRRTPARRDEVVPFLGGFGCDAYLVSPDCDAFSTCSSVANGQLWLSSPPAATSDFTCQVAAKILDSHILRRTIGF